MIKNLSISASKCFLYTALAALHLMPWTPANAGDDVAFRLTLLHTNDGESQLINAGDGLEDFGGIARFVTRMEQLQVEGQLAQAPRFGEPVVEQGVVTVSSGDNFLAGVEFQASLEKGEPFYDTIGLSRIQYDAKAIGNHEFDFGPEVCAAFIRGFRGLEFADLSARPTFVTANLGFQNEPEMQALVDAGIIRKFRVINIGGTQVGIVGATTPALGSISSPRNVDINPDVAGAVQEQIDILRNQLAVDKIIFISHLQSVNEDTEVIAHLSGIDIAVAGGGSELLANEGDLLIPGDEGEIFGSYPLMVEDADGNMVPMVTTTGDYRYIGRLVVGFNADGEIVEIDEQSGPVRIAGGDQPDAVESDPFVQARVVDPVAEFAAELDATVVASTEVELDGRRAQVRSVETNQGNLCADAILWQANLLAGDFGVAPAHVGLQNGGGIRNNNVYPVGDLTARNTFDIFPFGNFVTIVPNISVEQFVEILENCVSAVEDGSGRFSQVAGVRFEWDAAGTPQEVDDDGNVLVAGARIVNAQLDDATVLVENGVVNNAAPDINVAIVDFLARGGDQYPFRGMPFTALGVSYQQALENYLVDALGGVVTAADYPEGGEGRITEVTPPPVQPENPVHSAGALTIDAAQFEVLSTGAVARFAIEVPQTAAVRLTLHDLNGRRVATVIDEMRSQGRHEITWNGENDRGQKLPTGVYFGRFEAGNTVETQRVVVVR